jgi:hypothetical protein
MVPKEVSIRIQPPLPARAASKSCFALFIAVKLVHFIPGTRDKHYVKQLKDQELQKQRIGENGMVLEIYPFRRFSGETSSGTPFSFLCKSQTLLWLNLCQLFA